MVFTQIKTFFKSLASLYLSQATQVSAVVLWLKQKGEFGMTSNQISYANLLETRRSNLANEELTRTRDERAHRLGLDTLAETTRKNKAAEIEIARHNKETESISRSQLEEAKRSNLARESQARLSHQETVRHNQATESTARAIAAETARSNKAREIETRRSAIATLTETKRSNMAKEKENQRANQARESETSRANKASEAIRIGEAATRAGELAERVRHDLAMESKDSSTNIVVNAPTTVANTQTIPNNSTGSKGKTIYPNAKPTIQKPVKSYTKKSTVSSSGTTSSRGSASSSSGSSTSGIYGGLGKGPQGQTGIYFGIGSSRNSNSKEGSSNGQK